MPRHRFLKLSIVRPPYFDKFISRWNVKRQEGSLLNVASERYSVVAMFIMFCRVPLFFFGFKVASCAAFQLLQICCFYIDLHKADSVSTSRDALNKRSFKGQTVFLHWDPISTECSVRSGASETQINATVKLRLLLSFHNTSLSQERP